MAVSKFKIAAGMFFLCLMLGGLIIPTRAQSPSDPPKRDGKKSAAMVSADQFDQLLALIKPKPGGFDDLPWMTDLLEARKKAAAEGKPLLVWVGDGHPLGWT